jgi:periplasmic copper chaperone A
MPSTHPNTLYLAGMLAGLTFLLAASIGTAGAETGSIAIENAWARATPAGAKVAAGYLTVKNGGDEPDRLVSASAEFAGKSEIHTMNMVHGMMQMRPVKDGLAVPARGSVALEPNSYHLMFMDLAKPLAEGDTVAGQLTFERAGSVPVEFKVMGIGAPGPDAETHHQHHHH